MGVRRWHVERDAVRKEHIPSGEIPYTDLEASTIEWVGDITFLCPDVTVAADVTGRTLVGRSAFKLESQHLKHLKSAKLFLQYAWAATADGYLELYDDTADVVLAQSTLKTGGELSGWEKTDVTGTLVAGNLLKVAVNITVAGAAGETVEVRRCILRLIYGVS